jgi:hypothetical protein
MADPERPVEARPDGYSAVGTDLTAVRSHSLGVAAHHGDLDRAEVRAWANWYGPPFWRWWRW